MKTAGNNEFTCRTVSIVLIIEHDRIDVLTQKYNFDIDTWIAIELKWLCIHVCADPEGAQGVRTLPKNHKKFRGFSNSRPDPLNQLAFDVWPSSSNQRNAI